MKKIFNYLIIVLTICLIIWGSFWLYENSLKTQPVQSASSDNVSGYAWSPNIGWISFNCTNTGNCSSSNYGVNIDSNGKLSGHAWSSSIGWISFNESDTGIPPSNDPCDETCIAKATPSGQLGKGDVPIHGWARALIYGDGWDGWIRFDHGQANEVYIDSNGEFHDWAWGGDVIGWISFNCAGASDSYPFTCASEGGDICQSNEFCPGEIWDFISDNCCSVECELKTCAEQGGDICRVYEYCSGNIIPASDTSDCCDDACETEEEEEKEEPENGENGENGEDGEDVIPEPYCGDGNLDPGEECDDNNNINGDGCSATCTIEEEEEEEEEDEPEWEE